MVGDEEGRLKMLRPRRGEGSGPGSGPMAVLGLGDQTNRPIGSMGCFLCALSSLSLLLAFSWTLSSSGFFYLNAQGEAKMGSRASSRSPACPARSAQRLNGG